MRRLTAKATNMKIAEATKLPRIEKAANTSLLKAMTPKSSVKNKISARFLVKLVRFDAFALGMFGLISFTPLSLAQEPLPTTNTATSAESPASLDTDDVVYTSYFRAGHSLSLLFAFQQTNWKIDKAGEVDGIRSKTYAPGYAFRYAFHSSLYRNFGMLVGTAVQTSYEAREYGGFNPGVGILFPSMAGGFVFAMTPKLRASLFTEYAAVWYPWMRTRVAPQIEQTQTEVTKVSLIPDMISVISQWDYFYSNTRAFSWAVGWRNVWNSCVRGFVSTSECGESGVDGNKSLVETIRIQNSGFFVQLGASWQPGDEL